MCECHCPDCTRILSPREKARKEIKDKLSNLKREDPKIAELMKLLLDLEEENHKEVPLPAYVPYPVYPVTVWPSWYYNPNPIPYIPYKVTFTNSACAAIPSSYTVTASTGGASSL